MISARVALLVFATVLLIIPVVSLLSLPRL
jgi:hypothetical protein